MSKTNRLCYFNLDWISITPKKLGSFRVPAFIHSFVHSEIFFASISYPTTLGSLQHRNIKHQEGIAKKKKWHLNIACVQFHMLQLNQELFQHVYPIMWKMYLLSRWTKWESVLSSKSRVSVDFKLWHATKNNI